MLQLQSHDFSNLASFYDCIGDLLLPNEFWGKNLDALNDILSGGFNIPESPFKLIWKGIEKSKIDLGKDETIIWLENKIPHQPENIDYLESTIKKLKNGEGETLFDMIVKVISENSTNVENIGDDLCFTI